MKLLLTIVQDKDAGRLQQALVDHGLGATRLPSTGGFLRLGNTTFLIGVEDEDLVTAKKIIAETCSERKKLVLPGASLADPEGILAVQATEVTVGGAIVFVLDVEEFHRI